MQAGSWHPKDSSSKVGGPSKLLIFHSTFAWSKQVCACHLKFRECFEPSKGKLAAGFETRGFNPGSRRVGEC